jgi:NAD(P)-dependent dehydrogenase (short-subunit alcohol dehydrogenase family)
MTDYADLFRLDGRRALVVGTTAADAVGAPDVLVTTPSVNVRKRIVDYSDAELDHVVDLNLKGTFRLCRTFGGLMAGAGRGSLIGFTSIRSQTTEPGQGAYAATKAGTVMLFKTLAAELGTRGVRANTVAPGVVETPLTKPIKDRPDWHAAYAAKTILRRWAQPSEVVGAVVFLASDASSYVTGTTLFVDGGWTAADGRFDPPA